MRYVQMRPKLPYLTISPTGWFEYRRSIPKNLRELFPRSKTGKIKSEWKAALKTKSPTIAQQLWVNENKQYEKVQAAAEYLRNKTEFQSTDDSIATAKQVAIRYGVHPEQAPKLDVNATHAEIAEFPQKISEWKQLVCEHKELLQSLIYENTVDEEQQAKDYQEGRWGQIGYKTPHKPQSPNDPQSSAQND